MAIHGKSVNAAIKHDIPVIHSCVSSSCTIGSDIMASPWHQWPFVRGIRRWVTSIKFSNSGIFFVISMNKLLTKLSICQWLATLWRAWDVNLMYARKLSHSPLEAVSKILLMFFKQLFLKKKLYFFCNYVTKYLLDPVKLDCGLSCQIWT